MGDLSTHFSRREFMCKCGCGFATVDSELLAVLEDLHDKSGENKLRLPLPGTQQARGWKPGLRALDR